MSPDPLDRRQKELLLALARQLAAELELKPEATCEALGAMLSDVAAADALREELVEGEYDWRGRPKTRKVGLERDGYAPDWLVESLQPHESPRSHWVEGVERAGFGARTTLGELYEGLA